MVESLEKRIERLEKMLLLLLAEMARNDETRYTAGGVLDAFDVDQCEIDGIRIAACMKERGANYEYCTHQKLRDEHPEWPEALPTI